MPAMNECGVPYSRLKQLFLASLVLSLLIGQAAGAAAVASCTDGRKNQDETDKDCGGKICSACTLGKACLTTTDCVLGLACVALRCATPVQSPPPAPPSPPPPFPPPPAEPSCTDGTQNGLETDVDCGGPCGPCGYDKACQTNRDCYGHCSENICKPFPDWLFQSLEYNDTTNTLTIKSSTKFGATVIFDGAAACTYKDSAALCCTPSDSANACGGTCSKKCTEDQTCTANSDCETNNCESSLCNPPVILQKWTFPSERVYTGCAGTHDGCGCIRVLSGTINGQSLTPQKPYVRLPSSTTNIQGSITLRVTNRGPSGWVAPLVAVRSWKEASIGFTGITNLGVTTADHTFSFNENIPAFTNGRGYFTFVYFYEMNAAQVASMTFWQCATGPHWGNPDDVALWTEDVLWQAARDGRAGHKVEPGAWWSCGGDENRDNINYCTCADRNLCDGQTPYGPNMGNHTVAATSILILADL